MSAAVADVRAAAHHLATHPPGGAPAGSVEHTASAVFWAIAAAQNVATRRPGGWEVGSELVAESWSVLAQQPHLTEPQKREMLRYMSKVLSEDWNSTEFEDLLQFPEGYTGQDE